MALTKQWRECEMDGKYQISKFAVNFNVNFLDVTLICKTVEDNHNVSTYILNNYHKFWGNEIYCMADIALHLTRN